MEERYQPPPPGTIHLQCLDYSKEKCSIRDVEDIDAFLREPRPDWVRVRWFNVDGLHPYIVDRLREHHGFHTLAAEDVLRVPQRPKVEPMDDHLFIVLRVLIPEGEDLESEQVSLFVYDDTILSIQEKKGDAWDPIRKRIANPESRLRAQDVSYLLYALIDSVVDGCYPILESYGDRLELLEGEVLLKAQPAVQQRIHKSKRELAELRRVIWPTRDVINDLTRPEVTQVSDFARTYLRDVYDHGVQLIDIVETYREMAASLNDLYMSVVSNRMNEIMKVLTIMASFFIPITFVAGVYGMNFDHIPELHWHYSYFVFWGICLSIVIGLLVFFKKRGWLGGGSGKG